MAVGFDIVSAWGFRRDFQTPNRLRSEQAFDDIDSTDGEIWSNWWFGLQDAPTASGANILFLIIGNERRRRRI